MQGAISLFDKLIAGNNPATALLAAIVVILAGVVVYQWRYTMNQTVPKWIWDNLIFKIEEILKIQNDMGIILDERLKK